MLPQRSWAASIPTLLSHEAFIKLLTQTPVSSTHGVPPSVPCCPLERFLGSVFLRKHMQRVVTSEESVSYQFSIVIKVEIRITSTSCAKRSLFSVVWSPIITYYLGYPIFMHPPLFRNLLAWRWDRPLSWSIDPLLTNYKLSNAKTQPNFDCQFYIFRTRAQRSHTKIFIKSLHSVF